MLLTIVSFLLVLSILVFVHELGHFWTARKFGVKAEEFGFGFPPRMGGFYKNNKSKWCWVWGNKDVVDAVDTIYSINYIPLGGFVKIKGENGEAGHDKDSFSHKPIWQRAIILSAGVSMNVLLAIVIISVGMMIGFPRVIDQDLNKNTQVSERRIQIVEVLPNTPAAKADLKIGDLILAINSNEFITHQDLKTFVAQHNGEVLTYKVQRGGEIVDKKITPEIMAATKQGGIGIAISEIGIVKYPWYLAIVEGTKVTFLMLWAIIMGFIDLIRQMFSTQGVTAEVVGPIGIASLTGQMAQLGLGYIMNFAAMLSLNLAVINFLPFPALDGGRIIFLLVEKIKGKPVKKEVEGLIHNLGFILLMILVLVVTFKDVFKFLQ